MVTLLNFDVAQEHVRTIENPLTRSLVSLALSQAVHAAFPKEKALEGEIDCLLYVRIIERAMQKHSSLQTLLSGGNLDWPWPE